MPVTASRLGVRRLQLKFVTSSGTAEQATCQFAEGVRARLADRLSQRMGGLAAPDDPRILALRRIQVELHHVAGQSLELLADRLAQAITLGVQQAMASDCTSLWFANPAVRDAAYLTARLAGTNAQARWFAGYDGLSVLPESAAIRTLLTRPGTVPLAVLAACAATDRAKIWSSLTEVDAASVLHALAALPLGVPDADAWPILAAALDDHQDRPNLAALVAAADLAAARVDDAVAWVIPVVRQTGLALQRSQGQRREGIDADPLPQTHDSCLPAMPKPLAEALMARRREKPADFRPWRASPLLGYALLLAFLDSAALDAAAGALAEEPDVDTRLLLRLLVLDAAAGPDAALRHDPVWRDICALSGSVSDPAIDAIAARAASLLVSGSNPFFHHAEAACRLFAARLPGFDQVSTTFMRANLFGAGGKARFDGDQVDIRLNRPPLDILLSLSGLDRGEIQMGARLILIERAP